VCLELPSQSKCQECQAGARTPPFYGHACSRTLAADQNGPAQLPLRVGQGAQSCVIGMCVWVHQPRGPAGSVAYCGDLAPCVPLQVAPRQSGVARTVSSAVVLLVALPLVAIRTPSGRWHARELTQRGGWGPLRAASQGLGQMLPHRALPSMCFILTAAGRAGSTKSTKSVRGFAEAACGMHCYAGPPPDGARQRLWHEGGVCVARRRRGHPCQGGQRKPSEPPALGLYVGAPATWRHGHCVKPLPAALTTGWVLCSTRNII
jgi:hypothetical protein